ncbi:MAG: hopanoid C-3 methylase HpnR [Nitrospirales bacterium]
MKVLAVHPGPLMYTKIFLRLEPLGLELVAGTARKAGHDVRLIDLQVETQQDYFRMVKAWHPDVIAISGNYLANVPEIIDLAKMTKAMCPDISIIAGGHSLSFVAREVLEHAQGAIDAIVKGEGEPAIVPLLAALEQDRNYLSKVPGVITPHAEGPPPVFLTSLDDVRPARDLLRHRRKYFLGVLDPCASIEFTRGCPWDCSFCSAWTFYGRSYRPISPDVVVDELAGIREPGVFVVDDVAFIQAEHGMAIGEAIARRGIKKSYYLETRGDVLLRNKEVFRLWRRLGMQYIFIGVEAIDQEGLQRHRKRISLGKNFEALEFARSLGMTVAINIIADPTWDRERFATVRQWCLEVPEVVNISVNTPYPGTETWRDESSNVLTRDYRLYDIQHAVLPTTLPLPEFYEELVKTQRILNTKHLGWKALKGTMKIAAGHLLRGQTNFVNMLWKFNQVYNPQLQLADHRRPVNYKMSLPTADQPSQRTDLLYIHRPKGRTSRALDASTQEFVDSTSSRSTRA